MHARVSVGCNTLLLDSADIHYYKKERICHVFSFVWSCLLIVVRRGLFVYGKESS